MSRWVDKTINNLEGWGYKQVQLSINKVLLGFRFKYSLLKCLGREKQANLKDLLKNLSIATRRDKSPGEVNNS